MIRIVFTLLANLLRLVFAPLLLARRSRLVPRAAYLSVVLDGAISEVHQEGFSPPWKKHRGLDLDTLADALDDAKRDPRVLGLVLTIRHLHAGYATVQSLREVLQGFRAAGKRVTVYLPDGGANRELLLAASADQVLLGAGASLGPLGFSSEQTYLEPALGRWGVRAEVFARREYKTAAERFVRDRMSEPQREQLGAILDALWAELTRALETGRSMSPERAREVLEHGLWTAKAAERAGLVDGVCYDDELDQRVTGTSPGEAKVIALSRYVRARRPLWRPLRSGSRVAVVEVRGAIVSRQVGPLPMAVEGPIRAALKRVREDRRYRGLLVVIDSRGGSALASERILRELQLVAQHKPVVAYLADFAASGGYMVALGAHAIVAQPLTLTGSIGVVSARFNVGELLERFGIRVEHLERGARSGMLSPSRPLSSGERELLDHQVEELYREFVASVARARGMPEDLTEPLARGRVWTGADAAQHRLVDQLGGVGVALSLLRSRLPNPTSRLQLSLLRTRKVPAALPWGTAAWLSPEFLESRLAELVGLGLASPGERLWLWSDIEG